MYKWLKTPECSNGCRIKVYLYIYIFKMDSTNGVCYLNIRKLKNKQEELIMILDKIFNDGKPFNPNEGFNSGFNNNDFNNGFNNGFNNNGFNNNGFNNNGFNNGGFNNGFNGGFDSNFGTGFSNSGFDNSSLGFNADSAIQNFGNLGLGFNDLDTKNRVPYNGLDGYQNRILGNNEFVYYDNIMFDNFGKNESFIRQHQFAGVKLLLIFDQTGQLSEIRRFVNSLASFYLKDSYLLMREENTQSGRYVFSLILCPCLISASTNYKNIGSGLVHLREKAMQ